MYADQEHAALLRRLRQLVQNEAETQRIELERQWSLPLYERVGRGLAIEGLRLEGLKPHGLAQLSCATNESRFREGDYLVLHRGDPTGLEALPGVLGYDDETHLEIELHSGSYDLLQEQPEGWIADESGLDLSSFYLAALDAVADTLRGRERILPLLSGKLGPGVDYARYQRAWEACQKDGLNDSQSEAVAQAYATDLVHLVQGPPGTGKTFVLAHLARLLVAEGRRVLITGLTHRAINNALNKTVQLDAGLPVCKIGLESRAHDLLAPNHANFIQSGFGDLPGGYIVGATPFATQTERLSHVEFDVVIFDEASQITLPLAIMGMLAGDKYIFIGDEKQLPPVASLRASQLARASIFGYLSGRGCETLLDITYRMNDVLTAWPSRAFYAGAIRSGPGVAERRLTLHGQDGRWGYALDPQQPAVFLDLGHQNNATRSRWEAETICELIQALVGLRLPPAEIGVVTPYRAQARLIRNLLRQIGTNGQQIGTGGQTLTREMAREIVVDTVERMQGQEREVVLLSLTTSSPAFAAHLAEFYFQPERLNVAITRPRTKLIIVGSRHVLQAHTGMAELDAGIALLGDLLSGCAAYTLD